MPDDDPLLPPLVAASGLGHRSAHRLDRRRAGLEDATFTAAGRAVGLLGPPGSGKSTLVSLITTALAPTRGRLTVTGLDPADREQRAKLRAGLGYVPQDLSPHPRQTVAEFLAYVGWLRKVPPPELPAAIEDSLLVTDLTELRDRAVRTLSDGMRQRVLLAQALVNRPSVVVLDSPTVILDPAQRDLFLARVGALRGRCAVVLATPLVESVAAVCDEVVVLARGRVAYSGTTAGLAGGAVTVERLRAGYLDVLGRTVEG